MPLVGVALSLAAALLSACGDTAATTTTSTTSISTTTGSASGAQPAAPLVAPRASSEEEAAFLKDVAVEDPALATYVDDYGNVALRSLLTDGSAFCAFLARGGGIDAAMVSLALGVRSVEKATHLPSTITTFNTIEATALLTLCPSEQALIPAADRARIGSLAGALGAASG